MNLLALSLISVLVLISALVYYNKKNKYNQNPEVITELIKAGAKINDRANNGWTPLMHAAQSNQNPEVISELIKAGAKIDDRNDIGWTPLMLAAQSNQNPDIVIKLIELGADCKAKDIDGKTAFDLIQENESLKDTEAYWMLNNQRFD